MIAALVLKAFAISLAGFAASSLASRCRASLRHAILLAMFVAIAVLPVASMRLPAIGISLNAAAEAGAYMSQMASTAGRLSMIGRSQPAAAPAPGPHGDPGFSQDITIAAGFGAIWIAGALLSCGPLLLDLWRGRQLRRSALPASDLQPLGEAIARAQQVRGNVALLLHESVPAPITMGVIRPVVILPDDARHWHEAALRCAFVHELEHIRRRDWLTQLFARVVCALFWFNPLMWMGYRRLTLAAEYACDDAVVCGHGAEAQPTTISEEGPVYADQLVNLARRMNARTQSAVLGMAQRSDLAARVHAVLDRSKVRGRAGAARVTLIGTAAIALLLMIAPLRLVEAPLSAQAIKGTGEERQGRASWRDRALVEAVDGGDIRDVRELLDDGANVNAAVDGDGSPLIVASREGHLDIVLLLLERGADVNLPVEGDGSPLIMAAREGHLKIVQVLLEYGARIDMPVVGDENALIQASGEGRLEVVKFLVARGADVNFRVVVDAPYTAALTGADGVRRTYDARMRQVRTPLTMATRAGHEDVVAFLRSAGAVR